MKEIIILVLSLLNLVQVAIHVKQNALIRKIEKVVVLQDETIERYEAEEVK